MTELRRFTVIFQKLYFITFVKSRWVTVRVSFTVIFQKLYFVTFVKSRWVPWFWHTHCDTQTYTRFISVMSTHITWGWEVVKGGNLVEQILLVCFGTPQSQVQPTNFPCSQKYVIKPFKWLSTHPSCTNLVIFLDVCTGLMLGMERKRKKSDHACLTFTKTQI